VQTTILLLIAGACCAGTSLPQKAAATGTTRVDLRPQFERWGLTLKSQGGRGTCSVFAITGGLEFAASKRARRGVRLSEEYLNWASNRAIEQYDDGGFFHDLWKGYEQFGIAAESDLPYADAFDPKLTVPPAAIESARRLRAAGYRLHWIKEWDVKTGLTEEQFQQIQATLRRGWPVCAGMRWHRQERWADGVLQMRSPEEVFDGHSVLLIGYEEDARHPGGGVFLIRDSAGGGRYAAIPYAYARAYINDAAWIGFERAR
jgi:C1A family cysteine protease